MQDLEALKQEAVGAVHQAVRMVDLRDAEVKYLGRRGLLTEVLRGLKDLSEKERKEKGREANAVRSTLEGEIAARRIALEKGEEEGKLVGENIGAAGCILLRWYSGTLRASFPHLDLE